MPHGSGGSTPAGAPAPPHVTSLESSSGVESTYTSNSTLNTHLTAQCAEPGKNTNDSGLGIGVSGAGGREEWIANSGSTFHVTGDPSGMVECVPP